MWVPSCLVTTRHFATWAEAVLWSATVGGHPYVTKVGSLWAVHYLRHWGILDDESGDW